MPRGLYVNTAVPQIDERVVGNESSASIEVVAEPIFDLTTLIGKVWLDQNENGIQDEEEVGIAGARIGTVRGEWITTDQFGRFSLPGVDPGRNAWGRNEILKLDTASLPKGVRLTTPNPLVRRITGGLMQQFDFGVRFPDLEAPIKQPYEIVTKRARRVDDFIDPVRFESGQFEISPRYIESLRAAIASLGGVNNLRIIVEGHTDSEPLSARLASVIKIITDCRNIGRRKSQASSKLSLSWRTKISSFVVMVLIVLQRRMRLEKGCRSIAAWKWRSPMTKKWPKSRIA